MCTHNKRSAIQQKLSCRCPHMGTFFPYTAVHPLLSGRYSQLLPASLLLLCPYPWLQLLQLPAGTAPSQRRRLVMPLLPSCSRSHPALTLPSLCLLLLWLQALRPINDIHEAWLHRTTEQRLYKLEACPDSPKAPRVGSIIALLLHAFLVLLLLALAGALGALYLRAPELPQQLLQCAQRALASKTEGTSSFADGGDVGSGQCGLWPGYPASA